MGAADLENRARWTRFLRSPATSGPSAVIRRRELDARSTRAAARRKCHLSDRSFHTACPKRRCLQDGQHVIPGTGLCFFGREFRLLVSSPDWAALLPWAGRLRRAGAARIRTTKPNSSESGACSFLRTEWRRKWNALDWAS